MNVKFKNNFWGKPPDPQLESNKAPPGPYLPSCSPVILQLQALFRNSPVLLHPLKRRTWRNPWRNISSRPRAVPSFRRSAWGGLRPSSGWQLSDSVLIVRQQTSYRPDDWGSGSQIFSCHAYPQISALAQDQWTHWIQTPVTYLQSTKFLQLTNLTTYTISSLFSIQVPAPHLLSP